MQELKKVLIIDDNEANLFSLKKILERLNINIHTAISGLVGLKLSEENKYSLILLDIQMPEMDGFETLEKLRQSKINSFSPVILVSAIFTEDQYKLKGILTGAYDLIPKPVNPEILRAKVNIFLELEEHKTNLELLVNEVEDRNKKLILEISKRKKVEADLRKAKNKAEHMNELKSQLLMNMSHEIRTPVNSILGFADLIANPSLKNADKERYVKYVSHSSQNLLFLIDEILDHSRIEAGEFIIHNGECYLPGLLDELSESFTNIKNQQGKSEIGIFIDSPEQNNSLTIETDPQRLKQVLINLLSNALKYTSEGEIHFGYRLEENILRFHVKDTGIGIDKKELPEVFNRFKRVESQESLQSQGTGLGLSIAKKIVELLGGKIGIVSEINKGSEFFFTIPNKVITSKKKVEAKPSLIANEDPDWSNFNLLIAEDEEMNYLFLQEALRLTKINISWVKNGMDAVSHSLQLPPPDLVLMDVKMPDMDGFEAIRQIRKKNQDIPIIIQTAFARSDDELEHNEKIFDGYITKPINRITLFKKMSEFLV
ncbi:MAG: response regulator [Bacteroidetes bacterium]|nr:response regulator [Bacteroidota bacterium]MBT4399475.1 response regulator [Bacteroidota bacterium]MBT4408564.1 response regulator [Bacteroidota bacterium]MBT7094303.1 response regulator [Bacteroidota bacterium]MBT7462868.1 response regulator [Bacteroidota bacterium]